MYRLFWSPFKDSFFISSESGAVSIKNHKKSEAVFRFFPEEKYLSLLETFLPIGLY